jgi:succinyl-CoA synthetase beta subunit
VLLVATMPGQEPPWPSPGAVCGLRSALAATAALRRPPADPARLDAIAAAARAIPVRSRAATSSISGWLAEHEAKAVLAEHVPIPRHRTVALGEIDAAVTAAREVGYPVALKLSARGLLHKSETGALALNLRTDHEVRAAAVRLLQITGRPDQLPDGPPRIEDHATPPDTTAPEPAVLLVEQMAEPGLELLIAARRDGLVPALTIGLGGIWAETLDDVVVIPLPVEPDQVLTAVHTLRAAPLLTGGRGRPPVDLTALATIAARIGDLLLTGRFSLIEVNPLILGPDSAVAVDALVRY